MGALRSRELIEDNADKLCITVAGIQALGSWELIAKGSKLIDYWRGHLGKTERLVLQMLIKVYPREQPKDEVAAKPGFEAVGGVFNHARVRLRTIELVLGRGDLRANENYLTPE
jgi:hypothetical protein